MARERKRVHLRRRRQDLAPVRRRQRTAVGSDFIVFRLDRLRRQVRPEAQVEWYGRPRGKRLGVSRNRPQRQDHDQLQGIARNERVGVAQRELLPPRGEDDSFDDGIELYFDKIFSTIMFRRLRTTKPTRQTAAGDIASGNGVVAGAALGSNGTTLQGLQVRLGHQRCSRRPSSPGSRQSSASWTHSRQPSNS